VPISIAGYVDGSAGRIYISLGACLGSWAHICVAGRLFALLGAHFLHKLQLMFKRAYLAQQEA
jgi:hypothetical protein